MRILVAVVALIVAVAAYGIYTANPTIADWLSMGTVIVAAFGVVAALGQISAVRESAAQQTETSAFYERLRFTQYFLDSSDIREASNPLDEALFVSKRKLPDAKAHLRWKDAGTGATMLTIFSAIGAAATYLDLDVVIPEIFLERVAFRCMVALFVFEDEASQYLTNLDSSEIRKIRKLMVRCEAFLRSHEPQYLEVYPDLFKLQALYSEKASAEVKANSHDIPAP